MLNGSDKDLAEWEPEAGEERRGEKRPDSFLDVK